jgi:hypothetical protein
VEGGTPLGDDETIARIQNKYFFIIVGLVKMKFYMKLVMLLFDVQFELL